MDIQTKEALIAEIEKFKKEALKMHIAQVLADSYTNTNLFDCNIDSDGSVIWYKAQARQLWDFWQAAKAQAVPNLRDLQERIGGHQYYHDEHGHMIVDMDDVVKEISGFDGWKAQAVPEGFILMPKVPTERMVNATRGKHEGAPYLPYSIYEAFVEQATIEAQEQKG